MDKVILGVTEREDPNVYDSLGRHCSTPGCIMQQRLDGNVTDLTKARLERKARGEAPNVMKLGYIKSQYEFSEQFLGKNRYYFGMILCEGRHPSIDVIHNLLRNLSQINDGLHKLRYLDVLYEQGQTMITKRFLKYF